MKSRIYENKDSLRFEWEMSGRKSQDYHNILVSKRFEEFEDNLTKKFILDFDRLFPLRYCYFDWLVKKFRPIKPRQIRNSFLKTDYLVENSLQYCYTQQQFVMFLQFWSFTEKLSCTTDNLGSTSYRVFSFKIKDFLKFQI